ncbi:MAG: KR domain-containing protein [Rhodanobacteraceae bacterium]|nr:KR domain-containing protein [Rhodanobacteraceae bacterium]
MRLLHMPVDGQGSAWVYRNGGVYVSVGGAGGLGEVLSEHLVRGHAAQVVWIGRRDSDAGIRSKQDRASGTTRSGIALHPGLCDAAGRPRARQALPGQGQGLLGQRWNCRNQ